MFISPQGHEAVVRKINSIRKDFEEIAHTLNPARDEVQPRMGMCNEMSNPVKEQPRGSITVLDQSGSNNVMVHHEHQHIAVYNTYPIAGFGYLPYFNQAYPQPLPLQGQAATSQIGYLT